ncbi:unnamed protein product, partial [marine sediment metagenome]
SDQVAKGVDTRGLGGYVLAPGSSTRDGGYSWLEQNPIANLPDWLAEKIEKKTKPKIGKPSKRKNGEAIPRGGFDNEVDIIWAKKFFEDNEPLPEGSGSDFQCFQLACRLRDRGLSKDKTIELMAYDWDHQHDPEWVVKKIENAYRYAKGDAGSDSIMSDFPDDLEETFPKIQQPNKVADEWVWVADASSFIRRSDLKFYNKDQWKSLYAWLVQEGDILNRVWRGKFLIRKFDKPRSINHDLTAAGP